MKKKINKSKGNKLVKRISEKILLKIKESYNLQDASMPNPPYD